MPNKTLSSTQTQELISILKDRFKENMHRHNKLVWETIEAKLLKQPEKLSALKKMEETAGEPDVIGFDKKTNSFMFCDCSPESPKGRRSLCYDAKALQERKEHPPQNNVIDVATAMGIELLDEKQYRNLETLEIVDTKTSSWIKTPDNIRKLGGALFADYRYGQVFVYHNGASSYYAARGFRGMLWV